jgi:hypothetical protein
MSLSKLSLAVLALGLAVAAPSVAAAQTVTGTLLVVIRGAVNDPSNAGKADDPADAKIPQIPVVYED